MIGRLPGLLALCLVGLAGCAGPRGELRRAPRADPPRATRPGDLAAGYQVYPPDVLEVSVAGRPECSGRRPVLLDGAIELAPGLTPRVEGLSAPQIASRLARQLHLAEPKVEVRVAEHNSQSLYLFGETGDGPQVVAYRGPETVLDLFNRLPRAARLSEVGEVHVVRSHVADGKPPEVFHVDLHAILLRHDLQTNVRLEPSDRISIAPSQRSRLLKRLPPWLRALGRKRTGEPAAPATARSPSERP